MKKVWSALAILALVSYLLLAAWMIYNWYQTFGNYGNAFQWVLVAYCLLSGMISFCVCMVIASCIGEKK